LARHFLKINCIRREHRSVAVAERYARLEPQRTLNVSAIFRQAKPKSAYAVVSRATLACSKKVRRIHWYRAVNAKAFAPASAVFATFKIVSVLRRATAERTSFS
jgi:hypothetical protein